MTLMYLQAATNSTTKSETMLNQIESLTARCIVNEIDANRINELMQKLKEQLQITEQIHQNRAEEMRFQQETVFGELLNEKNSTIVALQMEVGELKVKLKERTDHVKNGHRDELLVLKNELYQLKEILKVKQTQINELKDELIQANDNIESLEIERQPNHSAAEVANEDEIHDHLKIISKALRSNQKLVNLIEIETIA